MDENGGEVGLREREKGGGDREGSKKERKR